MRVRYATDFFGSICHIKTDAPFLALNAEAYFSDVKSEAFSIDPKNIGDSVRSRDRSTGTCFDTPLFWLEKTFNYILS